MAFALSEIGFVLNTDAWWGVCLFCLLYPLTLTEADARAAAVLVNKLDTGRFKCAPDHLQCRASGLARLSFQLVHRNNSHARFFGEFILGPPQERKSLAEIAGGK